MKLDEFTHKTSYTAPKAGRDRHLIRALGPWLDEAIHTALAAAPGSTVLDVGCGAQPLRPMVERLGGSYVGMDVVQNDAEAVSIIGPIDGDLPEPWPDARVDYPIVLCTEVLEHVKDWERAFTNLRSLVAPGGRMVVTTPFFFPLHMQPHDYFRATPFLLERMADDHGFAVERLDRLGDPLAVVASTIEDVSIVPVGAGIMARAKASVARKVRNFAIKVSTSEWWRSGLEVSSNHYLGSAAVLKAA